jgi:hypothetical protein
MSTVKRVEFVSDRMSYIILRGRWCNIIVLNVHAPTANKTDDIKGRFNEELEQVFNKFPKYHMNILLGDFNAKLGLWFLQLVSALPIMLSGSTRRIECCRLQKLILFTQ